MSLQFSARRAFGAASILALGLSPLALSGTAHADEISASAAVADSQRLEYTAPPGVANSVVASVAWSKDKTKLIYRIDDVIRIGIGDTCVYPDKDDHTKVRCVVTPAEGGSYPTLTMKLGDEDDKVWLDNRTKQTKYFAKVALGPGADWLDSTSEGLDGSQVLGQGGDDQLKIGPRSLAIAGNGDDMVWTWGKNTVADGGKGDDQIWGHGGRQLLAGGDGDDKVWGGDGDDDLWGNNGDDWLWGQGGADRIWGGDGNDGLDGGPGLDVLRGGPGTNKVHK
ncbi:hypothetical protein LWF15_09920 [Kineosporia rhizophila]|uniref:hypothetical protein n=1 Tax=Kineosporia TaxID=49184 RepID=UPI001E640A46|nr:MULTISPECIES: hypothetical protein [Kineosporia]MCE0535828.1 hypothetical protein [Kineosporia rhizophila]GLY18188.1 hypothetical protein Kisp01_52020 [Kineosporia sp. NBRC 101677]